MSFAKLSYPAAAAALLILAGCGAAPEPRKQAAAQPAVTVRAAVAAEQSLPEMYEATGTVRARLTTVLSARVMGYLRELKPQAGDTVSAGQVVATLEAREIEVALRQAEAARAEARSTEPEVRNAITAAQAQRELAEATFRRMRDLFEKKSISNQEFDETSARRKMAQANHQMATARLEQLRAKIKQAEEAVAAAAVQSGYLNVTAPFAGVVTERKAEPGMLAAPGMPLLVIEQTGAFRLEAAVDETRAATLRPGAAVTVVIEALGKELAARISEIVPALDAASRTQTVKIDLPALAGLRSGQFGRARFALAARPALLVPAAALSVEGQLQRVFVPEAGTARARLVTTGSRHGEQVEILTGLKAGESVVSPVPAGLVDGARVEVQR